MKDRYGFTLMELLAVIVIIAILAAIAIPASFLIVKKIKELGFELQKKFIVNAAEKYVLDKGGKISGTYITLKELIDADLIDANIKDNEGNLIPQNYIIKVNSKDKDYGVVKLKDYSSDNVAANKSLGINNTFKAPVTKIKVFGNTTETGTGTKAPNNKYTLNSVSNFNIVSQSPNFITNGDFPSFAGWGVSRMSFSTTNNILTCTGNSSVTYFASYYQNLTTMPRNSNRKLYMRAWLRSTTEGITRLLLGDSNNGEQATSIFNPEVNKWYLASGIYKTVYNSSNYLLGTYMFVSTGANLPGKSFDTKEFMAVDLGVDSSNPLYDLKKDELDKKFSEWQPKETVTLNFPYTLRSLPDGTKDNIEIDYVNKTAKIIRKVGAINLTGFEEWTKNTQNVFITSNGSFWPNSSIDKETIKSSHEVWNNISNISSGENGMSLHNTGSALWWKNSFFDSMDVTSFKSWLATQNSSGTPVIIQYKLAEPVTEVLSLGNNFYTTNILKTYNGLTNFYKTQTVNVPADLIISTYAG